MVNIELTGKTGTRKTGRRRRVLSAISLLSGYKSNRINWLPESTKSFSQSGA
jgi:hypothetical protein